MMIIMIIQIPYNNSRFTGTSIHLARLIHIQNGYTRNGENKPSYIRKTAIQFTQFFVLKFSFYHYHERKKIIYHESLY